LLVDQDLCIGCGECVPYCPVGAISMQGDLAVIDFDECVECANCQRCAPCPTEAFVQQELVWPRVIRSIMSNVLVVAPNTGIPGRGTEEMKTNDVTGRFKRGWLGVGIEMGRPIVGARFRDVQKVAMAVAELGVEFEAMNPVTAVMADPRTGKMNPEILDEKVYSAIIEFAIPEDKFPDLMTIVERVSEEVDTVFSLEISARCLPGGDLATTPLLEKYGCWAAPNGKTCLGLGKPPAKE
jgi:NAD-dependent dihydropyrimidine dehydrogenase PreA subunit